MYCKVCRANVYTWGQPYCTCAELSGLTMADMPSLVGFKSEVEVLSVLFVLLHGNESYDHAVFCELHVFLTNLTYEYRMVIIFELFFTALNRF